MDTKNSAIPSKPPGAMLLVAGLLLGLMLAAGVRVLAAELAPSDKTFLLDAAESCYAEITASKAAQGKATSSDIRAYAAKVLADHQQLSDELQTLAAQKGVKVPDEPSKVQQEKIARLNTMSGRQFDLEFASEMGVAAHQEAVALYRRNVEDARDPDVKSFAARTLPGLEHHLDMARALKLALDSR